MTDMKTCELCKCVTSGTRNERLAAYEEHLFNAAKIARDERALVFMAKDHLNELVDTVSSSSRRLPHEPDDFSTGSAFGLRYPHAEDAKIRLEKSIEYLTAALDSVNKHLGGEL